MSDQNIASDQNFQSTAQQAPQWPDGGEIRVPYWLFQREDVFQREQENLKAARQRLPAEPVRGEDDVEILFRFPDGKRLSRRDTGAVYSWPIGTRIETASRGNRAPYGLPVRGSTDAGPVDP